MKQDDEEAGGRTDGPSAADEETDEREGPQPLPPPSVLDASVPPPPPPHYSRLELRQLEGDGDTSHCWAGLPARHVPVRSESFLADGTKAPSEPLSTCLAVELFRSSTPVYNVAGRADSPCHTLHRRASKPLGSVFVVNLMIPAADGVYQVRAKPLAAAARLPGHSRRCYSRDRYPARLLLTGRPLLWRGRRRSAFRRLSAVRALLRRLGRLQK